HRRLGGDRSVPRAGSRDPRGAERRGGRPAPRRSVSRSRPIHRRGRAAARARAPHLRSARPRGRGGAPRSRGGPRVKSRSYVFLGLSITSSWGNGHATTYRALLAALAAQGHRTLFLERDLPFYAKSRDLPGSAELYTSFEDLTDRFGPAVRD